MSDEFVVVGVLALLMSLVLVPLRSPLLLLRWTKFLSKHKFGSWITSWRNPYPEFRSS